MIAKRHDWQQSLPGVDVEKLLFLDESAVNTAMVRDCGRCPRGERLVDSAPAGLWQTSTLVAAICLDGVVAPMVVDGPLNGESFAQYVESSLVPELNPGTIVVMDNLPVHKSKRVADAIVAAGCILGLSATLLAGLQPDREHVVKGQNAFARGGGANVRDGDRRDRDCVACNHSRRLRRLFPSLWIRRATKLRKALGQ